MARNGSGTYSNPYPNFVSGTVISSSEVDANNSDIATALTQSIAVEGQSTVTGSIPMNSNKFTGLAVGAAATDSLSLGQAQAEAFVWCGTASGSADAITLSPSPAITAYAAGQRFVWMASGSANTGATTVAISGLSAIALQDNGAALVAGNHAAGKMFMGILNTTSTVQIMQVQSSGTDPLIVSSLTVSGDALIGDDLTLNSDAAILGFGENKDVTLTHVHDTGLLLNGAMQLQFSDSSQYINAPSATILDINATDEVELNATLVDVNANLDVSGTALITGVTTHGGNVVSDTDSTDDLGTTGVRWANLFVDGITATDQITATGFTGTLDGILGSGTPAAATVTTLDASGVATATTFEPDGDTSTGDNAALGYTSVLGAILTGQGSTNDVTLVNDADATVLGIPTGTTNVAIAGDLTANNFAGKNLVINGGFQVNQRVYVSTTAPADGTYMHDRWRSGTANSSYAFSTASPASPQTVTIAANDSIEQVIEGSNIATAGTHTISWTGTATARAVVNTQSMSGNFAVSPITVTAALNQLITMQFTGANAAGGSSIATNTGTLGKVQCELGSVATEFEQETYSTILAKCQRYYEKSFDQGTAPASSSGQTGAFEFTQVVGASAAQYNPTCQYKVKKRAAATVTFYNWNAAGSQAVNVATGGVSTSLTVRANGDNSFSSTLTTPGGTSAGTSMSFAWTAEAEL